MILLGARLLSSVNRWRNCCGVAEGHSYPMCNNVILMCYSWAYDKFEQAINRAHRINSLWNVNVYPIICDRSIDRKLEAMIQEKGDASELVLDGRLTHWLVPGGTLTAIMPHPNDDISAALGDADDLCSWTTEDIDAGAFKASGTNIRTSLLLLEKSASTAEAKLKPLLPPSQPPIAIHSCLSDLPLFALPETT